MISGVALDESLFASGTQEVKPAAGTDNDPSTTKAFDGFGDRFSAESAQTLLGAQESLPQVERHPASPAPTPDSATDLGTTSAQATPVNGETNPLDSDKDGVVSFVEWLKGQSTESNPTARTATATMTTKSVTARTDGTL